MYQKRPFRKSERKRFLTAEQKVEQFILRNSDNGYFTRFSTIHSKFEISQEKAWEVIGNVLAGGEIEAVHDGSSGEMKLCKIGTIYRIMSMERGRRTKERRTGKKPPAGNAKRRQ